MSLISRVICCVLSVVRVLSILKLRSTGCVTLNCNVAPYRRGRVSTTLVVVCRLVEKLKVYPAPCHGVACETPVVDEMLRLEMLLDPSDVLVVREVASRYCDVSVNVGMYAARV